MTATRVDVRPLFRPLGDELLRLLRGLEATTWNAPAVGGWAVRDVVAHLLDGDLRRLSFHRDAQPLPAPDRPIETFADLTAFLNGLNASWVEAAKRIGPRALTDLLAVTTDQVATFFESLDLDAPAFLPVTWAGESRSLNWLDLGREYTERWHHQQQVREAAGAPLLTEPRWLSPVLRVAVHAIPRAYAGVAPAHPVAVAIEITGPSGGVWSVDYRDGEWRLVEGGPRDPAARVSLDEDTAWRLLHRRTSREDAQRAARIEGERPLALRLFDALAVMA
jgi:uncharacterized protein (TIGR03083 family)